MNPGSYKLSGEDKEIRYEDEIIYRGVVLKQAPDVPILAKLCVSIPTDAVHSKACFRNASYSGAVSLFRAVFAVFIWARYCFVLKHEAVRGCLPSRESPQAGHSTPTALVKLLPWGLGAL